jgi:hypothetical protein
MNTHTCDNDICKLLNPCIDELLPHSEVMRRIKEAERNTYFIMKNYKTMDIQLIGPLGFYDWATHHMIYQVPNIEFIQGLSNKIRDIGPRKIIEVGSGRGIICRYISNILHEKIILTDSYSWWKYHDLIEHVESHIDLSSDVLKRTYIEAIEEFKPDLIIASWIPYNECWTKDFRKYPFVNGYILIGEGRGGATGSEEDWDTDWNLQYLDDVSKCGICKTDLGIHTEDSMFNILHTVVTYFERPKKNC